MNVGSRLRVALHLLLLPSRTLSGADFLDDLGFETVDDILRHAWSAFKDRLQKLDERTRAPSQSKDSAWEGTESPPPSFRNHEVCPLIAYPKSGSEFSGQFLNKALAAALWGVPHWWRDYKEHCMPGNFIAFGHMWSWEWTTVLFVHCFREHVPARNVLVLARHPIDNVMSRSLQVRYLPAEAYAFGFDFASHGINATEAVDTHLLLRPENRFEEVRRRVLDETKSLEIFAYLRWHLALRRAAYLSGRRVITLYYEDLLLEPHKWLTAALNFCGVRHNVSFVDDVVTRFWQPDPAAQERARSGQLKWRRIYADRELTWLATVLQSWDPRNAPWLVEPTQERRQWAVHPDRRVPHQFDEHLNMKKDVRGSGIVTFEHDGVLPDGNFQGHDIK